MRLPKLISALILLLLGASFAVGNIWLSAARSTIPLRLNGFATGKARLLEKTLGVDDVYVITLDESTRVQVDASIYEAVVLDRRVRKDAWSTQVEIDGKIVGLDWSADFTGMMWTMPSTFALLAVLGILGVLTTVPRKAD